MSSGKPSSFTPYFTVEDADQVRAVYKAVGAAEGYASLTDLIEAAILKEVRRLQRKYNGGKAWPPVPAGALRTGQRTRAEAHLGEK